MLKRILLPLLLIAGLLTAGLTASTALAQTPGTWGSPGKIVKGFLANDVGLIDAFNIQWGPEPAGNADDTFTSLVDHLTSARFPWTDPNNLNDAGPADIADGDLMVIADASDSFAPEKVTIGALRAEMQEGVPSGGLNQAAVDSRVEAYTGQNNPTGSFARDRIPLATATQPGAISSADQALIEALPPQGPGQADKLVGFDGSGNYAAVDAPAAGGSGDITGVTAGTGLTGGGTTGNVEIRLSGESFTLAEQTKLAGIEDGANDYQLPGNIAALADDITGRGYQILSGVVGTTHTASQSNVATASGYTYANFYATGPRYTLQFWYFRLPVDTALDGIEARVGDSDNTDIEQRIEADDWTALGNLGGYDYYVLQLDDKPAGDALIVVQLDRPTLENVDVPYRLLTGVPSDAPTVPPDGSITPEKLDFLSGNQAGNAITISSDGTQFKGIQLIGQREVFNGAGAGVNLVNSLDSNSQTQTTSLSDPVNIRNEGHGLIGGTFTLTLTERSANTIRWDGGPTVTEDPRVNITGFVSLEALAQSQPFNASANPPQVGVTLATADVYNGTNLRGVAIVRLAHDGTGNVAINLQYLADPGGSTDTATGAITISGNLVVLATGAPRGESGTGGPIFEYATALPDLSTDGDEFTDGSLAVVYSGAAQGLYRKTSSTVHVKADTGLAGDDIEPTGGSATLQQAADGRYTALYVARSGFTGRGGASLAANNGRWSAMPAALAHAFLSYRTTTRGDGWLEFKYSSARTYTGDIRVTAGSLTLDIQRIDSATWRLTGLTAAQVGALRENVWRLSEPGQTGTVTTHRWDPVLRVPQIVQLWAPSSHFVGSTFASTGIAIGNYDRYGIVCGGRRLAMQWLDGDTLRAATATAVGAGITTGGSIYICPDAADSPYLAIARTAGNVFLTGAAVKSGSRSGIRIYGINLN